MLAEAGVDLIDCLEEGAMPGFALSEEVALYTGIGAEILDDDARFFVGVSGLEDAMKGLVGEVNQLHARLAGMGQLCGDASIVLF